MRLFNNTKFDDDFVVDFVKPHILLIKTEDIESIEVSDDDKNNRFNIVIFGIECILWEGHSDQDHEIKGKIRWFNESSGEGTIRLDSSNKSIHFFSCNVIGANSLYPELVTNIEFVEGENVTATLSSDMYMVKALGLVNIKKVG